MAKEIVSQVVIDRCPSCGGVWLDGGELEMLRRALEGGHRDPLARTVVLGLTGS
jgi:Zn-finger nucleic acid-binding protein